MTADHDQPMSIGPCEEQTWRQAIRYLNPRWTDEEYEAAYAVFVEAMREPVKREREVKAA